MRHKVVETSLLDAQRCATMRKRAAKIYRMRKWCAIEFFFQFSHCTDDTKRALRTLLLPASGRVAGLVASHPGLALPAPVGALTQSVTVSWWRRRAAGCPCGTMSQHGQGFDRCRHVTVIYG